MDPITQQVVLATAGAAGAADATYVDDVFSTFLYEGNGGTATVNNGIDLSGEGGLLWIKNRSSSHNHVLVDSERSGTNLAGNQTLFILTSNNDTGELTNVLPTLFTSTGFTTQYSSTNGDDFASWSFRKAPGFFDVVTYTGSGSARTVSHNLGSVPGMIIIKRTSSAENWATYHRTQGATKTCRLNGNFPFSTSSSTFNNTEPTSTEFTVGTNSEVNSNGDTFVAYLFAHDDQSFGTDSDEAIIKCGSFTSDSGGAFDVNLGWEPQLVLIKASSTSGSWYLLDAMRGLARTHVSTLRPNTDGNDLNYVGEGYCYAHASGFASDTNFFGASTTFVYMAIRRPHKPPEAGTDVFKAVQTNSQPVSVGFPTDLIITAVSTKYWVPRLTNARLQSSDTSPENDVSSYFKFDLQNSFSTASWWGQSSINWYFRRAPGFFDVVAYTGTGSLSGVNHNLGVTPQLKIIKSRSDSYAWIVGGSALLGENGYTYLNTNGGVSNFTNYWDGGDDSATQFSVRNDNNFSDSAGKTYVAYLFATLDGISKVGTYTGTGSNINVDCGFTAGARFVVIKRADIGDSGNWYVWDTTRGIVSGNDPYLLLNTTTAAVTNTDYIDPLNAGFTVTSSAPADLNASGGNYLFLAIA